MAPDGNIIERSALAQAAGKDAELRGRQDRRSSRLSLVTAIVLVVVVFLLIGLVFTQPWSKVRLRVYNQSDSYVVYFVIYIDGERAPQDRWGNPLDSGIAGIWSVKTGTHRVAIDYYFADQFTGVKVGENKTFVDDFKVGLLNTKDVYAYLSPS